MPEKGEKNRGGLLDSLQTRYGGQPMRDYFHALAIERQDDALALLNDGALHYPTLYLLESEIVKLELGDLLSDRNRLARLLAQDCLSDSSIMSDIERPELASTLRWMLRTGWQTEHLGEQYDEIIDGAAVRLAHHYHDESSIETIGNLLFARHRKNQYSYDLQWAFFAEPAQKCLRFLQSKLDSADGRDKELARELLSFAPDFQNPGLRPDWQCRQAKRWLKRNRPYLRYTGAGEQEGNRMDRWELVPAYQYLNHHSNGAWEDNLSGEEQQMLAAYSALAETDRQLLSECSCRMRRRSPARWRQWIGYPMERQLAIARRKGGLR